MNKPSTATLRIRTNQNRWWVFDGLLEPETSPAGTPLIRLVAASLKTCNASRENGRIHTVPGAGSPFPARLVVDTLDGRRYEFDASSVSQTDIQPAQGARRPIIATDATVRRASHR